MKWNVQAMLTVALLAAALVLGNFLSTRHFARVDLTENGTYTLSEATKKILGEVDDAITIKAYFSEKFPPALLPLRRDVLDLLAEVKASGKGMVTVEYLDPAQDEELKAELEKLGVRPDPIQILEKDQVQAVNVYKSIVLYHADKKEVVPSLMGVQDLEYNLAVAIKKLSLTELPTVAFLGFKDGPSTFMELQALQQELKKLYDVDTAVVTGGKPIGDGVKTLVVIKPKDLTESEAYQVDQFLMRGGKAIFLIDGMAVDLRANPPTPTEVTSGLEGMLEAYGVKVGKTLVFDPTCETVSVQVRPGMRMAALYPPLVSAIFQNMNPSSPVVARISKISFPWVSPLEVTDKAREGGREVIELIKSTDQSWIAAPPIELAPDKIRGPQSAAEQGQRLLAVAVSGTFKSAWEGKPAPPVEKPTDPKQAVHPHKADGTTRLIVVGDADHVMREFMSPGGLRFFQNAVDWLTLDDSLIGIRTKSDKTKPLPKMEDAAKRWFRAINIGLAPILVTAFGLVRLAIRRSRQARGLQS